MDFEELVQLQVLKLKASVMGRMDGQTMDHLIDQAGEQAPVRQMCAKVSNVVYSDLENVCELLDMSKREFIESAVVDALRRAHDVINRSGVEHQMAARS